MSVKTFMIRNRLKKKNIILLVPDHSCLFTILISFFFHDNGIQQNKTKRKRFKIYKFVSILFK